MQITHPERFTFRQIYTTLEEAESVCQKRAKFNWLLDESKFLTEKEVTKLRKETKKRADNALKSNTKTAVRDWFVIDLAMSTGLRVQEMADLKCNDIFIQGTRASLVVRNGKGGRSRLVRFSDEFKNHLQDYLNWKEIISEPTSLESPLI
ncbi:MAG: site-specific integrase, partial [Planctomycetota bacterium]